MALRKFIKKEARLITAADEEGLTRWACAVEGEGCRLLGQEVGGIVRGYRGTLDVQPSRELGGTRFEVQLPPGL